MRRELISAYAASASRVASWAVVTGVVYRVDGPRGLALIAVARATVGFLAYAGLGIAPALVTILPRYPHSAGQSPDAGSERSEEPDASRPFTEESGSSLRSDPASDSILTSFSGPSSVLAYATPERIQVTLSNAVTQISLLRGARFISLTLFALIAFVGLFYAMLFENTAGATHSYAAATVGFFAGGLALRVFSDVAGAALQSAGRIATDNWILTGGELAWTATALVVLGMYPGSGAKHAALFFMLVNVGVYVVRFRESAPLFGEAAKWEVDMHSMRHAARQLLPTGITITFAALADFLYAPLNLVLLTTLRSAHVVAAYAPVLQLDAGLLVLVGGLSAVLLPKAAGAMGRGDLPTLRRYYVRGTLVSFGLLAGGAAVVVLSAPWLLRAWLGEAVPLTLSILPWVMIHTAVGGASGVGRAVLLGMGRAKAVATSALIAGVCNVGLAYLMVGPLGLGVWGVVYATIFTVTLRCAVWMPWYVLRATRSGSLSPTERGPG